MAMLVREPLAEPHRSSSAERYFAYYADFVTAANSETLLTAYQHYVHTTTSDPWKLWMIGHSGDLLPHLQRTAASLDLSSLVTFFRVSRGQTAAKLLRDASGILAPVTGTIRPEIEQSFASFGKPMLVAWKSAVQASPGQTVLYADPRRPLDLSEAMRRMTSATIIPSDVTQPDTAPGDSLSQEHPPLPLRVVKGPALFRRWLSAAEQIARHTYHSFMPARR